LLQSFGKPREKSALDRGVPLDRPSEADLMNRAIDRTLELRYGPADIPVMEPYLRAYALVNGRRIAVTEAVQIELFGG
jgi:hypothetical protein